MRMAMVMASLTPIVFMLSVIFGNAYAATYYSIATGDWNVFGTWSASVLFYPGELDGAAGLRFMGVLDAEHNYRPKIF